MNWRESLKDAIRQATYAKDAKAPSAGEEHGLLHLLHTNYRESQESDFSGVEPDQKTIGRALGVLNAAGVRIVRQDSGFTVGVWSDLDGPEIRAALRTLGMDSMSVRYLDSVGIPMRYKVRRVEGEPVPMSVLTEMERHARNPGTSEAADL